MAADSELKQGKYRFGPVTDKDDVRKIKTPRSKDISEVIIFGEREVVVSFYQTGRLPDPRITLPLYQNMEVFNDDIFLCAYPKCGTHWVWEMCRMLIKGKADFHSQAKESCMMELHMPEEFNEWERPRLFNTHMTPMWIPQRAVDKDCKLIFLRRNPKDIVTSRYHHNIRSGIYADTSWHSFLQYTLNNDHEVDTNWFFYNQKWREFIDSHRKQVIVLNYEDIKLNTLDCLSKLAEFIGYQRDEEILQKVIKKCSINNMREMEKGRDSGSKVTNSQQISNMYRKGVVGDWKEQFTVAENEQFDAFLTKNMKEDDQQFKYEL